MQGVSKVVVVPKLFKIKKLMCVELPIYAYTKVDFAKNILNDHKFSNLRLKMDDGELSMMKQSFIDNNVVVTEYNVQKYLILNCKFEYYTNVSAIMMSLNGNSVIRERVYCYVCVNQMCVHIKFACEHQICEKCYEKMLDSNVFVCPFCEHVHSTNKISAMSTNTYNVLLKKVKKDEDAKFRDIGLLLKW